MSDRPNLPTIPFRFCPVCKTNVYLKDCLEIRCPYHAFWNALDSSGGSGCEYHDVKKAQTGGGE